MSNPINLTSGRLLARNTILNLVGNIAPTLVGVLAIPYIIRNLGPERFGLLSLAWIILGYFGILDFGLGDAAVRYVAEALGNGAEERVPRLLWTAVTIQVAGGIFGAVVLIGGAPFLTTHVLRIAPGLVAEATTMFRLLALSVPVVLISGSFCGVLTAAQRFDLTNLVSIPSRVASFLLPVVALFLGWNIVGIALLLVISRYTVALTYYFLSTQIVPNLRSIPRFHWSEFKDMAVFGGWVTVSDIVGPSLIYLDRFVIGALIGMSALTYYTVPFEVISRFWLLPGSLVATVFPAFSTLGIARLGDLQRLYAKSLKYLALAAGFAMLMCALFCGQFLRLWLGVDFARHATLTAQIVLIGSVVGLIAPVPGALLAGCGRPDVAAKLYVLEVPLNIISVWLLVKFFGLPGAGISFALRTFFETAALLALSGRVTSVSWRYLIKAGVGHSVALVIALAFVLLCLSRVELRLALPLAALTACLFWALAWSRVLDSQDRNFVRSALKAFPSPS